MNVKIVKSFSVSHPPLTVWNHLTNPEKIVSCVPGAQLTETVDADNFKGEVELKFGPVKARYGGAISFLKRDESTMTMQMKGVGTDVKGKGGADMLLDGAVQPEAEGSKIEISMDVTVQGMLAQFGSRLASDATSHVLDQFIKNLTNQLDGKEVDNSLSATAMVGSMIKGIFTKS